MRVRAYRMDRRKSKKERSGLTRLAAICGFCLFTLAASIILLNAVSLTTFLAVFMFSTVFSNFVEYAVHRWPMHRLTKLKALYKIHSGEHHRYFTHEYMSIETKEDMQFATTNARTITMLVGAIMIPMSLLLGGIFGANVGLLFYACAMSYYILYELTHFSTHLPVGHWLLKLPYFKGALQRHRLHHNSRLMREWNFNVSLPLFDWIFGTLHPDTTSTTQT